MIEKMLEIRYNTETGRGCFTVSLGAFLPCSKHDFAVLLGMIRRSENETDHAETIAQAIIEEVKSLQKIRDSFPERDTETRAKYTSDIRKYCALSSMLAKEYGTQEATDADADAAKTKKADVFALIWDRAKGAQRIEKRSGFSFRKYGRTFTAYEATKGRFVVLLPSTGLQIAEARTRRECPQAVDAALWEILNRESNAEKLTEAEARFSDQMRADGFEEELTREEFAKMRPEARQEAPQGAEVCETEEVCTDAQNAPETAPEDTAEAETARALYNYCTGLYTAEETRESMPEELRPLFKDWAQKLRTVIKQTEDTAPEHKERGTIYITLDHFRALFHFLLTESSAETSGMETAPEDARESPRRPQNARNKHSAENVTQAPEAATQGHRDADGFRTDSARRHSVHICRGSPENAPEGPRTEKDAWTHGSTATHRKRATDSHSATESNISNRHSTAPRQQKRDRRRALPYYTPE